MAKKMNYKKAALVGLGWSMAYFAVVWYYTYMDLGFNLLSSDQWQSTYIAFVSGLWAIDSKEGGLLVLTILLFFPLWITGWMIFYKTNWRLPVWLQHKEKAFKRELILNPNKGKAQIPVKLRLQNNSFKSLQASDSALLSPIATVTAAPVTAATVPDSSYTLPPQTDTVNDIQSLVSLSENYAVDTFQNVVLDDQKIPLAISTDDVATLIMMLDKEGAAWAADLSENGEWYTAGARIASPIALIKKAAVALQELEPDSQIIPVLVITRGEIMDTDSVVSYCANQGIHFVRFNEGRPETLPTLEDFMNDTFPKKEA